MLYSTTKVSKYTLLSFIAHPRLWDVPHCIIESIHCTLGVLCSPLHNAFHMLHCAMQHWTVLYKDTTLYFGVHLTGLQSLLHHIISALQHTTLQDTAIKTALQTTLQSISPQYGTLHTKPESTSLHYSVWDAALWSPPHPAAESKSVCCSKLHPHLIFTMASTPLKNECTRLYYSLQRASLPLYWAYCECTRARVQYTSGTAPWQILYYESCIYKYKIACTPNS